MTPFCPALQIGSATSSTSYWPQYAVVGESEFDDGKLPALLELKYGTAMDAVRELGSVAEFRATFLGLQSGLYEADGWS